MAKVVFLIATFFFLARDVHAYFYDLYRTDYPKTSNCQVIGSACSSDTEQENAFFQNPAALESGEDTFVWDSDYGVANNLEPGMKGTNDVKETDYMAGLAVVGKSWSLGLAMSGRKVGVKSRASLIDDKGNAQTIGAFDEANTVQINLIYAAKLAKEFSVGAAVLGMYYKERLDIDGAADAKNSAIDRIPPVAVAAGFLYSTKYFRFGSWGRTPSTYYFHQHIDVPTIAYKLEIDEDVGLHFPWIVANGFSIMPWGDRRTLLFDLIAIGGTTEGYERTYDTFSSAVSDKSLRKKGRSAVLEPHIGWRGPLASDSKFSIYLGSYYETSRWEGLPSRPHGTGALAYNFFNFVEAMVGADIAKSYFSLLLTVH